MPTKEFTIVIHQNLTGDQVDLILDFLDGLIDPENYYVTSAPLPEDASILGDN